MRLIFNKNNKKQYLVDFEVCISEFIDKKYALSAISKIPDGGASWFLPQYDIDILKKTSSNLPVKFDNKSVFVNDYVSIYLIINAYIELANSIGLIVVSHQIDGNDGLDKEILADLFGQLKV